MKIHILEDELDIANPLETYLKNENFAVVVSPDLNHARRLEMTDIDLHILDWRLPDGEGVEYLKHVKLKDPNTPVIMLSAKAELVDKVLAIELGANDYITKPFLPRELLARIKRHIEASKISRTPLKEEAISVGDFSINILQRSCQFNGVKVTLKKLEFDLLLFFLRQPMQVFSRDELLEEVWKLESYPTTRTVDNHILALRKKTGPEYFKTVHGAGYQFVPHKSYKMMTNA